MRRATVAATLLLAAWAGGAAAQSCGLAASRALVGAGGMVGYDIGAGLTGLSAGGDLEAVLPRANDLELRVGYRLFLFDEGPDPHVGRATLAVPLLELGGIQLCASVHGGVSYLSSGEGDVSIFAGGAGLRLAHPMGTSRAGAVPYIEVRGLGGSSLGDLGGLTIDASAQSVGVEAGLIARLGPALLRIAGEMDGFPAGLGITPYPQWAGHIGLGLPF